MEIGPNPGDGGGTDETALQTAAFNEMVGGLREREEVKDTFGKYVSPEVTEYLLQKGDKLGGETRDVSVLIARLPAFYSMAEGRPPQDIADLLNDYFARVVPPILSHHGGVDQYVGSTVIARFGAPIPRPEHRINAVAAALEIRAVMEAAKLPFILTINSGLAFVGDIGTEDRLQYTIVGEMVNDAFLMASLQEEHLPRTIILGENTFQGISDLVEVSLYPFHSYRKTPLDPLPYGKIAYQLTGLKAGVDLTYLANPNPAN